mgnify:FL=1
MNGDNEILFLTYFYRGEGIMNKLFLFSLGTALAMSFNAYAGGSCGSNCTWDLKDGVLTISGTGRMRAYEWTSDRSVTNAPWGKLKDQVTSVVVSEGITNISNRSFHGMDKIESFKIPNPVTSIDGGAMEGLKSLKELDIPNSVKSIGTNGLEYLHSLKSLKIPDSVTSLGNWALAGSKGMENLELGNGITYLGRGALRTMNNLKSLTLGENITYIASEAFGSTFKSDIIYYNSDEQLEMLKTALLRDGADLSAINLKHISEKPADDEKAGRRFYTPAEAAAVVEEGTGNTVEITF